MQKRWLAFAVVALVVVLAAGYAGQEKQRGLLGSPETMSIGGRSVVPGHIWNTGIGTGNTEGIEVLTFEDFEGATFPPTGWTLDYTSTLYWSRYVGVSGYGTGAAAATFTFYNASSGVTQSLVTPTLTATVSGDSVKFDHAYATYTGGENDQLLIETSPDGSAWATLVTLNGGNSGELVTAPGQSAQFVPTASQWASKAFALPVGTTKVRFKAVSAYGNNLFIDNISIGTPETNDVGTLSIDMPLFPGDTLQIPGATVKNFGSASQSFPVTMKISPGGYSSTQTVTSLGGSATAPVTFTSWTPVSGTYTVTVYTNLGGDAARGNDTARATISVIDKKVGTWSGLTAYPGGATGGIPNYWWGDSGKVFLAGGSGSTQFANCYFYNPSTNAYEPKAALPMARSYGKLVRVHDKLYLVGSVGVDWTAPDGALYEYDPVGNAWATKATLPAPAVHEPGVCVWRDSLIIAVGGSTNSWYGANDSVRVYNPASNTWTVLAAAFPLDAGWLSMECINDEIIALGGITAGGAFANIAYRGTVIPGAPISINWRPTVNPYGQAMYRGSTAVWGTSMVFGTAQTAASPVGMLRALDITDSTITALLPDMPSPPLGNIPNMAIQVTGGAVNFFMFGGYNSTSYATAWKYSISLASSDVASSSLDLPLPGGNMTPGVPFAPKATFTNVGTAPQTSIPVRFQILNGVPAVVYTNNQTIPSLAPAASAQVTFSSVPGGLPAGAYTMRAIALLGGDGNASNDTVAGSFAVAPSIADYVFSAAGGTFTALTGGTVPTLTGGTTDDGYFNGIPIGFTFTYNGLPYTTVAATTNGCLFPDITLSSSYLTNDLDLNTVRPVIAPLWDDLETPTGMFSYKTEGASGSQVFTAEWLNVEWNYSATGAVISFQAKLYEADSRIEFIYREEATAVNSGSASIGITDALTGPGHFLSLDGTGTSPVASSTTETATLSTRPATGQVYTFAPAGGSAVTTTVAAGWNMISNPMTTAGDSVSQLFPTSIFPYAFSFAGGSGYQQQYRMLNGVGYWGKFPSSALVTFSGTPRTIDTIEVAAGWNMVGSVAASVDTGTITSSPAGLRSSTAWFGYSGGYSPAVEIEPGKAYWVKASGAGSFYFVSGPVPSKIAGSGTDVLGAMNTITIRDGLGREQKLFFREGNGVQCEMPPLPPEGAFDARFVTAEGGALARSHDAGAALAVSVQSAAAPVTISWSVKHGTYTLDAGVGLRMVSGEGSLALQGSISRLTLTAAGSGDLPVTFALMQNYPNPFNPATTIRFALPVESKVSVEVFNALGQRVKTLVEGNIVAGFHEVEWNGTGGSGQQLGSGVYFVRFSATGTDGRAFGDTRKLMLLK